MTSNIGLKNKFPAAAKQLSFIALNYSRSCMHRVKYTKHFPQEISLLQIPE